MGQCGDQEGLRHLIMAAILDTLGSADDAVEHFRLSTLDEGKKCLEDVRDNYHGYDFENRLNVRIHAALKNLS
ncbi:Tetratricopeptide repeat protein 39C-like 4 [Homarus americanus]|uniref:Tetratricopeptide repeat protein 39C-like 4 n=1 Tax=Homarus americanus TaxID=6706 RepID=A0A8J5KDG2_HOMAM|nr:Tetratricopeptide repeat protein 39C-like 4 [Homarus americanus]